MTKREFNMRLPALLIQAFFALMLLGASSSYAATTFKIATLSPDGSSWMVKMRAGADRVKQLTQGEVVFKFYPGGVMGSDATVLRKIRMGQLQGAAVPAGSLVAFAPVSQLYSLPMLFDSYEEIDAIRPQMDARIVADVEQGGLVTFGLAEGGFAYFMSNTPVASLEDLRQKKLWIPDNDTQVADLAKLFDISPIPLSMGDVLPSLQTGMIDTIATSPLAAIALQWHTQVQAITDLPLVYLYAVLGIDGKAFARLSKPNQQIVRQVMGETFHDIDQQNRKDNLEAMTVLVTRGAKLIAPENPKRWDEIAIKSREQLLKTSGIPKDALDQMMRLLQDFRHAAVAHTPATKAH